MAVYCKNQSAARPYVIGVSGVTSATSVSVFAQTTNWYFGWWYVPIALLIWFGLGFLLFQTFQPINTLLIRLFGAKTLEKEQRGLSLQIVQALFDRKQSMDLPNEDDDLVKREAAVSLINFLWSNKNRG